MLRDRAFPAACYFAKRALFAYREWDNERKQFCITTDAQRALNWVTFILGNSEGAKLLRESGVEQALQVTSQTSADDDLKKNITQALIKINEGRIATSYEQESARHSLLSTCASNDLRAMLVLAQECDPKLFYASLLVYSLEKAPESDYLELLKGSLQLLAQRMPEPDSNFILNNTQKTYEVDTPQSLVLRIIQSNHFQQAKQKCSATNFMCEVGEILHRIGSMELPGASFCQVLNARKIRQCGKDLIYKARDQANVRAQWKVLALQDPNAQTVMALENSCQSTLKAIQKPDESLSPVIAEALQHIEE